jgi:hypothetical protein
MLSDIIKKNNLYNFSHLYNIQQYHYRRYKMVNFIMAFRLISLYFTWKQRKELNKSPMNTYDQLGDWLPIRAFFTYTNYSNFLALFWFLTKKTHCKEYYLAMYTCLFITTAGFWTVVYPKMRVTSYRIYDLIIETANHGPVLLSILPDLYTYKNDFSIINFQYPIYYSAFWLFGIWTPWFYMTHDPLYKDFIKFDERMNTLFKMFLIGSFGFLGTVGLLKLM